MNIYQEDGVLDIDAARDELRATRAITLEKTQRARIAEINAAALLDIAASLRPMAAEVLAAMTPTTAEPEPELLRNFLVIGDLVHVKRTHRVGTIAGLSYDGDGALVASVDFEDGPTMTFYAAALERLVGDEREDIFTGTPGVDQGAATIDEVTLAEVREAANADVALIGVATGSEAPALLGDEDEDGEAAVGGYDIDDVEIVEHDARELVEADIDADFDGDEHDEAAAAVARLKENEAKRKAAKKAAKPATKKGSKK